MNRSSASLLHSALARVRFKKANAARATSGLGRRAPSGTGVFNASVLSLLDPPAKANGEPAWLHMSAIAGEGTPVRARLHTDLAGALTLSRNDQFSSRFQYPVNFTENLFVIRQMLQYAQQQHLVERTVGKRHSIDIA